MRSVDLVACLLAALLVIWSCDASELALMGINVHARGSGSESSSHKSPHHDGHAAVPSQRTGRSHSSGHPSLATQPHPAHISHAHAQSVSAASAISKGKQPGQLGHLVESLRPGSRRKSYKQPPSGPWWKEKGGQPARSRGRSPSPQNSQAHGSHAEGPSGSSSTDPKHRQAGNLGHLAASVRPGVRPTNVKQDRRVAWWKQAGGQPRRTYGTSPVYDQQRLYRERKKFRKELQDLIDKPYEHFEKRPHEQGGGGPGSPGAGGSSHAVSKRRLRSAQLAN